MYTFVSGHGGRCRFYRQRTTLSETRLMVLQLLRALYGAKIIRRAASMTTGVTWWTLGGYVPTINHRFYRKGTIVPVPFTLSAGRPVD